MGDIVNDAYWRRSKALEDRLHVQVVLASHPGSLQLNDSVRQFVTAQSDEYDVICGHTRFNLDLAASQYLMNLHQYGFGEYIDISQPYWSKLYIENVNYKDNLYWLYGQMTTSFVEDIYCIFVNTSMWEDYYAGQNPYDMVFDNQWTMDKLHELCDGTYKDLNGNGKKDEKDQYGTIMHQGHMLNGVVFACDVQYTGIDEAGEYSVALDSEHTVDVFEKFHAIFVTSPYSLMMANEQYDANCLHMFTENRVLFATNVFRFSGIPEVRNMESDFSILPLPKYDENQKEYHTTQYAGSPVYGVPTTVHPDHIPAVASTLEAMCSMTSQMVIPVYYDVALKNKYSRDEMTAQMVELIRNSITADFCFYWGDNLGGLMNFFYDNIYSDSISSKLKGSQKVWDKMLTKLLDRLDTEQE